MVYNDSIKNHIEIEYYCYDQIARNWRNSEIFSNDWRFYYNFDGGSSLTFKGRETRLTPDSFYLIPPLTPLISAVSPGANPLQLYIHFRTGEPHNRVARGIYAFPIETWVSANINFLMADLKETDRKGSLSGILHSLSFIAQCLDMLPRDCFTEEIRDFRIDKAIREMEKDIAAPLSTKAMACEAELEVNRFIKLFKEQVGCTPYRYLTQQRIRHSLLLMTDEKLSLEEIGELCGYCDRYQFSRMFKKVMNTSPGEYRKKESLQ